MSVVGQISLRSVRDARIELYAYVLGSAAFVVIIPMVAGLFRQEDFIRFVLTLLWFGCLASVTWSATEPLGKYLREYHRWKYSEAGPAINHTVGQLVVRMSRFAAGLGWVATASVGACALYVLSFWEVGALLEEARLVLWGTWLLTMIAVPLYPIFKAGALNEIVHLRRQLHEQLALAGLEGKSEKEAAQDEELGAAAALKVLGPLQFRAGGYDWHFSDFYKNAVIFGMTGSGKTVCVLNAVLDGLLGSSSAAGAPCAGLILDPKGDFRDKIELACRRHGRSRDLIVIDPYRIDRSARFNPIDSDDSPFELADRFASVIETLNSGKSSEDTFWIDNCKKFIQYAIILLREAKADEGPPNLTEIYDCATQDDFLKFVIDRADANVANDSARAAELERARTFAEREWFELANETKSSARSFLTNMLLPFLEAPFDELFGSRSTKTMGEILDNGHILYVYMPIADRRAMARIVCTFVKLEFYREVLKRVDKTRPSFFLCDEFQAFFTVGSAGMGDNQAFERTRQSNHANIIATQNLPALTLVAPKEDVVTNLLGNCGTKIFLRNTDDKTNEYASKIFGERIETLVSTSQSVTHGLRRRPESGSVSSNASYGRRIRADVFTDLAVPSQVDAIPYAEAMVHLAARARVHFQKQTWTVHPL